jgi:DNA-binding transcriptional LysR family regulator
MDRLHEMEVFIAVADAGSFAKAGTRLRISAPAVTRAVSSLEGRLGARLLNRTTRSLSLTEAGSRFLDDARRLVGEIDAAEKAAAGDDGAPRGHLTVTASVTLGRSLLTPIVSAFLATHPHVSVSVLLLDRVVNLVEEGIDVGIRIGQLADSSLVARRVGTVRRILVASPDYLRRHGTPATPADLRAHAVVGFSSLMPNRQWRFAGKRGAESVAVSPRFEINDALAAITAAEAGDGITIALSYMVAERIRAGRLATVLEAFAPEEVPVQLVHPQTRLIAPSVRAFVDFMAPRLRDALATVALGPGARAKP